MTRRTRISLAAACLPLLLAAVGCSNADEDSDPDTFSDDGEVPAESIEAQFTTYLEDAGVVGATDISCDPVKDEVDATTTCVATVDGTESEATVTVVESTDTTTTFSYDGTAFGIS